MTNIARQSHFLGPPTVTPGALNREFDNIINTWNAHNSGVAAFDNLSDPTNLWLNVKTYGAKGDGVSDDTTAIQNAINAAGAQDVVFFPGGIYQTTATLSVTKQIAFLGTGQSASLIRSSNNIPMITIDTTSADIYYISMLNFGILNTSGGSSSYGIKIIGGNGLKDSTFSHMAFRGCYYGVGILNTGSTDWTNFTNCYFKGEAGVSNKYGIYRTAVGTGLIVSGCRFVSDITCFYVTGSNFGDYSITGNQFYQNLSTSYCIQLISTNPNTYRDNIAIVGNHLDGNITNEYIQLKTIRSSIVMGNTMAGQVNPVTEDSGCTNNIIQIGYGVGTQFNKAIKICDTPTTSLSGFGTISPTAQMHLGAGTASAHTAPLKFTSGTNLTTPEAGAVEWDGTSVFVTNASPSRQTVAMLENVQTFTGAKTFSSGVAITATSSHLTLSTSSNTAVVQANAQATSSRTFSIPDISGNGTFAMLEGTQTFSGAKTFSAAVTVSASSGSTFVVNTTDLVVDSTNHRVGIGIVPVAGALQIKAASGHDLMISDAISVTGAVCINGINDSNGANIPIEIRASIIQVSSGLLSIQGTTPASAAASGTTGTIAWDSGFIYICTATNTWKRVAIASW